MSYEQLAYLHLATVVPAFAIGTWLLVRRKGTPSHRALGRVYLVLMVWQRRWFRCACPPA